jgi:polyisoprenoid-binding protein YceI
MSDTSTLSTPGITREVDGRTIPVAGTYQIDAAHTTVDFVARHMMVSKVRGSFPGVSGSLVVASVQTREEARDNHLRSEDFFHVERFPEMQYHATSARPAGDGWVVDGELTIKGVTRPVSLEIEFLGAVTDPYGNARLGFSATGELNREDFNLGWNMALEAGGVVVGKTVKLEIESELILAQS